MARPRIRRRIRVAGRQRPDIDTDLLIQALIQIAEDEETRNTPKHHTPASNRTRTQPTPTRPAGRTTRPPHLPHRPQAGPARRPRDQSQDH